MFGVFVPIQFTSISAIFISTKMKLSLLLLLSLTATGFGRSSAGDFKDALLLGRAEEGGGLLQRGLGVGQAGPGDRVAGVGGGDAPGAGVELGRDAGRLGARRLDGAGGRRLDGAGEQRRRCRQYDRQHDC